MSPYEHVFPQEQDRIRSGAIAAIGVVSVLVIVLSLLVVRGLLRTWEHPVVETTRALPRELGAGTPIDLTAIERDAYGLELRRRQRAALAEWRFVDREQGIATIPIEEAIELVVEGR